MDAQTVRTVYTTLGSVFPEVETWELSSGDMLLVGSKKPIQHDVGQMRARMADEPYKSAAGFTWQAMDVESFLAHFVAASSLARRVAEQDADSVNTDDQNIVEFGFARSVGSGDISFSVDDVRHTARTHGEHRPNIVNGTVDWDRVDDGVVDLFLVDGSLPPGADEGSPQHAHRTGALRAFDEGNAQRAVSEWRAGPQEPASPIALAMIGSALAELGDENALLAAQALRAFSPGETDAIVARLALRRGKLDEASAALASLFERLRSDPWPMLRLVRSALHEATDLATRDARFAPRLYAALREPFAIRLIDEARKQAALAVGMRIPGAVCAEAVGAYEPNVPWDEDFLSFRFECYRAASAPSVGRAKAELLEFRAQHPVPFGSGL